MPLRVHSLASYYTGPDRPRGIDMDAIDFIRAIKGEPIRGNYAWIPILGVNRRLTDQNIVEAGGWFAEWAAQKLRDFALAPYFLVSVPPRTALDGTAAGHRTDALATAIAQRYGAGATALSTFRWVREYPSTREGGPRDPAVIFANIRMFPVEPQGTYVLVDDVCTAGGHVQACAAALTIRQRAPAFALTAGKTFNMFWPEDPFLIPPTDLDDFVPAVP